LGFVGAAEDEEEDDDGLDDELRLSATPLTVCSVGLVALLLSQFGILDDGAKLLEAAPLPDLILLTVPTLPLMAIYDAVPIATRQIARAM
jgi:hypothetical protein